MNIEYGLCFALLRLWHAIDCSSSVVPCKLSKRPLSILGPIHSVVLRPHEYLAAHLPIWMLEVRYGMWDAGARWWRRRWPVCAVCYVLKMMCWSSRRLNSTSRRHILFAAAATTTITTVISLSTVLCQVKLLGRCVICSWLAGFESRRRIISWILFVCLWLLLGFMMVSSVEEKDRIALMYFISWGITSTICQSLLTHACT